MLYCIYCILLEYTVLSCHLNILYYPVPIVHKPISPNSITLTLRQSPWQVPDKVVDLLRTQIMKVRDTNHVVDFHDLCSRLCRELVADFFVDCIVTDQIPLERQTVCRGLVTDFVANISTCWDGLCPRLSPPGSFGESWHNGIRAIVGRKWTATWLLLPIKTLDSWRGYMDEV